MKSATHKASVCLLQAARGILVEATQVLVDAEPIEDAFYSPYSYDFDRRTVHELVELANDLEKKAYAMTPPVMHDAKTVAANERAHEMLGRAIDKHIDRAGRLHLYIGSK